MKKKSLQFFIICAFLIAIPAILSAQVRKIDIWDFGGVETKGFTNNNITTKTLDGITTIKSGKFELGELTFGDLTLSVNGNDRLYYFTESGATGKNGYGNQGYASVKFDDDYISNGIYYCNGTGGEGRRFIIVNNVKKGDKITFYARTSNTADEKVNFAHIDSERVQTGLQLETALLNAEHRMYEYIAKEDGSYKIFTNASGGKPVYYRVMRTPSVVVSGKLSLPSALANKKYSLKFVNQTNNQETIATVKGNTYSVNLAPGYAYVSVLTGIQGYGVTPQTKDVTIPADVVSQGKFAASFTVDEQKVYVATGSIKGFAQGYDTSKIALTFVPPAESLLQPAVAEIKDLSYKAILEPGVLYSVQLAGVNDYEIKTGNSINKSSDFTMDIETTLKPVYEVTGELLYLDNPEAIKGISFENLADSYVYTGSVTGKNYSVNLRDGSYLAKIDSDTYTTSMHVVVKGKKVAKNLKVNSTVAATEKAPLVKELYVGYKNKKDGFKTVTAAIKAAEKMQPASEKERITIYIAPGIYREQIRIKTPYITLMNEDATKEVKLTWYYGIGYKYYSIGQDGFYSEDAALDQFEKKTPARWGVATQVLPDAKYFRAEGITFESSFSKYITDEELEDGVESDGSVAFTRKLNSDPKSRKAIERSSAMCCEADFSEFYNCKFIGSQDTLFTGNAGHQYYKDCFIEGNTDYIFGDGNVVFDRCELRFCGYSDAVSGGYITAAKDTASKGYLFRNCFISQNPQAKHEPGFFGRPWGPKAKVAFINTKIDTVNAINAAGWTSMSGNDPEKASFREYNTNFGMYGVDTSKRTAGSAITVAKEYTPENYFEGWQPSYYKAMKASTPKFARKPALTSNDDLNNIYAGHVLTLHYSLDKKNAAYDTSIIQWYRVKDGKETLVKTSSGIGDKTYTVSRSDVGSHIKAVVNPENVLYYKGKALSISTEYPIKDGVAVVAAPASLSRDENKINIFLAGDSTVKDYSAAGMYNGKINRNEGAWGEFLQYFLSSDSIAVQNYANGGRSTRNFINEGTLDKIASQIKKGDYLFIQFGHNDASNSSGHLEDRFVPLGKPDAKGIYPTTVGKKVATPASLVDKYGKEFYSYESGTFKGFLLQYIEVARKVGATPVLVSPVARLYFGGDGKLTPHHDSKDTTTKTQTTKNNAYVEAVRQLAQEQKVAFIDGFALTKQLYEEAYAKANNNKKFAQQLMSMGDSTHNNKLGGFILAGLIAKEIEKSNLGIKEMTVMPSKVLGENNDGQINFMVNTQGKLSAFTTDSKNRFVIDSEYWNEYGQNLIDSFKKTK